jgi:hypothetical protein
MINRHDESLTRISDVQLKINERNEINFTLPQNYTYIAQKWELGAKVLEVEVFSVGSVNYITDNSNKLKKLITEKKSKFSLHIDSELSKTYKKPINAKLYFTEVNLT